MDKATHGWRYVTDRTKHLRNENHCNHFMSADLLPRGSKLTFNIGDICLATKDAYKLQT